MMLECKITKARFSVFLAQFVCVKHFEWAFLGQSHSTMIAKQHFTFAIENLFIKIKFIDCHTFAYGVKSVHYNW